MAAEAILALRNDRDDDMPDLVFAGAFLVAEFFALVRGLSKPKE